MDMEKARELLRRLYLICTCIEGMDKARSNVIWKRGIAVLKRKAEGSLPIGSPRGMFHGTLTET